MPSLRSFGPSSKPGIVGVHHERGDPVGLAVRVGHRHHRVPARHPGVGDPALGAVEHPLVAVATGPGPHRRGVRAGLPLGQRVADHRLAGRDGREHQPLQLLRSGQQDRGQAQAVDRRDERRGGADPGHLLDHQAAGQLVGALAAVLLRNDDRVEAGPGQRVGGLGRIATLLVDVGGVRRDLLLGQRAHRLAQRLVLVAEPVGVEVGVHDQSSLEWSAGVKATRRAGRPRG